MGTEAAPHLPGSASCILMVMQLLQLCPRQRHTGVLCVPPQEGPRSPPLPGATATVPWAPLQQKGLVAKGCLSSAEPTALTPGSSSSGARAVVRGTMSIASESAAPRSASPTASVGRQDAFDTLSSPISLPYKTNCHHPGVWQEQAEQTLLSHPNCSRQTTLAGTRRAGSVRGRGPGSAALPASVVGVSLALIPEEEVTQGQAGRPLSVGQVQLQWPFLHLPLQMLCTKRCPSPCPRAAALLKLWEFQEDYRKPTKKHQHCSSLHSQSEHSPGKRGGRSLLQEEVHNYSTSCYWKIKFPGTLQIKSEFPRLGYKTAHSVHSRTHLKEKIETIFMMAETDKSW